MIRNICTTISCQALFDAYFYDERIQSCQPATLCRWKEKKHSGIGHEVNVVITKVTHRGKDTENNGQNLIKELLSVMKEE